MARSGEPIRPLAHIRQNWGDGPLKWVRSVIRWIVMAVLLLLCAALFYVLVIMGGSQPDSGMEATPTQGALASMPQPALQFPSESLYQASYYFNAPIMTISARANCQLDSVTVSEYIPEGVREKVREVLLTYRDMETGKMVRVSSMTPSSCLSALPRRGFYAAPDQDWQLGSMRAVLMQSGSTLHLHAQKEDVVYQIEGEIDSDTLRRVLASAELSGVL